MSTSKFRKMNKKLHWGRSGDWGKKSGKGIKGISFYTGSDRAALKKVETED